MQIVFKAGTASSEQMRRLAVCNHWHAMHYLNVFAACSLHLSQDWRFRKNSLSLVNMSWQFIPLSTFQQSQVLLACIEEFQYHPSSTQHSEVLLASIVQLPSPDFKQDCWVQRWYAGGRWGLFPRSFRPYSYIAPSYLQWLFVWLCLSLSITPLNCLCPSAFLVSCLPLLFLSTQSSPSIIQLLRRGQCPRLPWPERSPGIPYVAPLSSGRTRNNSVLLSPLPLWLWLLLLSPGVVSLPSAPLWSEEPQRLQPDPWWLQDIFKRWC